MRYWLSRFAACGVLIAAIAACLPNTIPQPTITSEGFVPLPRDVPTAEPPPWREAGEAITLANAPQIAYLGRLDAPGTLSTIFAHHFSPDGTRLVVLNNERLITWDLLSGELLLNLPRSAANHVFYAPDKTEVFALVADGSIMIYDADTGTFKTTLEGHPRYNGVIAYYADGGLLAVGGQDGDVKVWDVAARQSLVTIEAQSLQISALAFSADGERLATAGEDGNVGLWNWRRRERVAVFPDARVVPLRLAISPDGQQVASGTVSTIELWSVADGTLQHTLDTGPGGITDVMAYAPDGRYLVSGGSTPAAAVWNPHTGEFVNSLPGIGGETLDLAFSSDGLLLASALLGGPVSLWNMNEIEGEQLARADLNVGTNQIWDVGWSEDGFVLAFFDTTGSVQIWGIAAPE